MENWKTFCLVPQPGVYWCNTEQCHIVCPRGGRRCSGTLDKSKSRVDRHGYTADTIWVNAAMDANQCAATFYLRRAGYFGSWFHYRWNSIWWIPVHLDKCAPGDQMCAEGDFELPAAPSLAAHWLDNTENRLVERALTLAADTAYAHARELRVNFPEISDKLCDDGDAFNRLALKFMEPK